MAEGILSKALKVVGCIEARRSKVQWVAGRAWDPQLLHNIGLAGERAHAAAIGAHVVCLGFVDHIRSNGPGVMHRRDHRFHGFGQVSDWHHVVIDLVLAPPGISSPQIHVGL